MNSVDWHKTLEDGPREQTRPSSYSKTRNEVPTERMKDVAYGQFVCTVPPEKEESNKIRFTVGGEETGSTIQVPWHTQQQKCWWPRCSSTASYQPKEQDSDHGYSMVSFFRLPWHKFIRIKLSDIPEDQGDHHQIQPQRESNKKMEHLH